MMRSEAVQAITRRAPNRNVHTHMCTEYIGVCAAVREVQQAKEAMPIIFWEAMHGDRRAAREAISHLGDQYVVDY